MTQVNDDHPCTYLPTGTQPAGFNPVFSDPVGLETHDRRPRPQIANVFAWILLTLPLLGCPAQHSGEHGSPPSPASAPRPVLRVGSSGDYAPFSRWEAGDETNPAVWTGFSIDIARAYAQTTERPLRPVRFQWPRLTTELGQDRFDLALSGITVRPDRSIAGRFSHPLTVSGAMILVEQASPNRSIEDLDDPEFAIAVNAGGHLERTARRLFSQARIEAVSDNHAVLDRLGTDGVVAVLTDTLEAPHWQARRPGLLRSIGPLTRDRKAAWFPVSNANEAAQFDDWLLDAERAGILATLRQRHGLPAVATCEPTAALLARLDERLSLMPEVARSKWIRGVAVEDAAREERVLAAAVTAVETAAERLGRPGPSRIAVLRLYRAQIEAAKAIQRRWIAGQDARAIDGSALSAEQARAKARLEQEIRPALLFLGDRIADLVVRVADGPDRPGVEALEQALGGHALPPEQMSALYEAIRAL